MPYSLSLYHFKYTNNIHSHKIPTKNKHDKIWWDQNRTLSRVGIKCTFVLTGYKWKYKKDKFEKNMICNSEETILLNKTWKTNKAKVGNSFIQFHTSNIGEKKNQLPFTQEFKYGKGKIELKVTPFLHNLT